MILLAMMMMGMIIVILKMIVKATCTWQCPKCGKYSPDEEHHDCNAPNIED